MPDLASPRQTNLSINMGEKETSLLALLELAFAIPNGQCESCALLSVRTVCWQADGVRRDGFGTKSSK